MAKTAKPKSPEVTDELIREIVENWDSEGEEKFEIELDRLGGLPSAKDFVNGCILQLSEKLFLLYAEKSGLINPDPKKIPLIEATAKADLDYYSKKWFMPIHSGPDFPDTKDDEASTVMRARRFWIIGKQDFSSLLDTDKAKRLAGDIAEGIALLRMEGAILGLRDGISVQAKKQPEKEESSSPTPTAVHHFIRILLKLLNRPDTKEGIFAHISDAFSQNSRKKQALGICALFPGIDWPIDSDYIWRGDHFNTEWDTYYLPEIQEKILPHLPEVLQSHINEIMLPFQTSVIKPKKADL